MATTDHGNQGGSRANSNPKYFMKARLTQQKEILAKQRRNNSTVQPHHQPIINAENVKSYIQIQRQMDIAEIGPQLMSGGPDLLAYQTATVLSVEDNKNLA